MKKTTWVKMIVIGALSLSLAACSSGKEKYETVVGNPDVPAAKNEANQEQSANETVKQTVKKTGIFIGMADNHTIEVEIDGKPKALQVPEDKKQLVEQIKDHSNVELEYIEKENGQLELKSITFDEKKEPGVSDQSVWKFVGLIDAHSAEFIVANQPLAVEYGENLRNPLENLKNNEEVQVFYKKDKNGKIVLEKVEKLNK